MNNSSDQDNVALRENLHLPVREPITVHELKEILDNFNQLPSFHPYTGHFVNILYQLENIDKNILTDPLIINHEFYSLVIHVLEMIFIKWHQNYYLPELESFIFCYSIKILFKIEKHSEQLIEPIQKCLKDIAKHGKHLYDKNNIKYFSILISLYIQNIQIINAIVTCLCSKYYIKMYKRLSNEEFLLITCPKYWMMYQGENREEMANLLLNRLLKSSVHLLQKNYVRQQLNNVIQLLDLLNYSFTLCSSTIFTNNQLLPITNALLSLLSDEPLFKDNQSIIKSILHLLITLISNNEQILQYVQQRQELFQNLIDIEDEVYIILALLMNNLEIITLINHNEKEALCYFNIGYGHIETNPDKSLEFIKKSLDILPKDDIQIGQCHFIIGRAYRNKSMFDEAIVHYKQAIEIYEKHLHDEEEEDQSNVIEHYKQCHVNIGNIFQNQQDYDTSIEYYKKIIQIMEDDSSHFNQCSTGQYYFLIGSNYFQKLEYDLSKEYYIQCLDFYEKHISTNVTCNHTNDISSCLINLGNTYISKNEYELALDCLEKAKNMLIDDHIDLGSCYLNIGICYLNQQQYKKGIENYQKAIKNLEEYLPDTRENYALCLLNMSICYLNMTKREYINAIHFIVKAIEIYQQDYPQSKNNLARCYIFYGFILYQQGRFDEAINKLQKSLDLSLDEDTINVGHCYDILGNCYYEKTEYEQALSLMKIALTNYEEYLPNLMDESAVNTLNTTALCLVKLNKCNEAIEFNLQSLEIQDQILSLIHLSKAESHSILALAYAKQQSEKCNEHCIKTLDLSKQLISNGDNTENIWKIFENIGDVYMNQNNLRLARKYYKKAFKYIKKHRQYSHPTVQRIRKIIKEWPRNLPAESILS